MTPPDGPEAMEAAAATLTAVTHRYGKVIALDAVSVSFPPGRMVGLIGPDGVGKSTILALIAGVRRAQSGGVAALGGDLRDRRARQDIVRRIAYMPQGLGRNLYPTLSVRENLDFFARLYGLAAGARQARIAELLAATGLDPFTDRPAGKLSGGMKQKLSLCASLLHDPDLLILDEPTTGVDPLSRRQFWELIARIRARRPGMSVIVATAYMDEAQRFDWLVAVDSGTVAAEGTPTDILARTGQATLEQAFVALLPEPRRRGYGGLVVPPRAEIDGPAAIEAFGLTKTFGSFTAVDDVSFRIGQGEIFGFLGSNGCGKSTTMKMLTGLLQASEGRAWLFGREVDPRDLATRRRVGYMSQSFSLYGELTVQQNLVLHARLFHVPEAQIASRVDEMVARFGLGEVRASLPEGLPLGMRQRLSLAVAMVHKPELLILDEPTSGVDPVARDAFWRLLVTLSRRDGVTIFISTHFMNEAERCDRMSMMHAGRVLDSDAPAALVAKRGAANLEEAFIGYLVQADGGADKALPRASVPSVPPAEPPDRGAAAHRRPPRFSLQRLLSYSWRESLELRRDPVRATLALAGTLILMFVIGFGVNMDVQTLRFAVLDGDQTALSRQYVLNLSGSRYFDEASPITDGADLDRRMRNGELALALEIPPGFARDVARGKPVELGAWVDGAMPSRAETASGYVQGMHQLWLAERAVELGQRAASVTPAQVETRFRYNPDVQSLPAMVPAVIPLLLMMIPAMLGALAVVREKELGSIINLYVTPVTRTEFLLGKQLPYIGLAMVNFMMMVVLAVTAFGVPITGSLAMLLLSGLLYVVCATGIGLLASSFTRSQVAALFLAMIGTMIPAAQYSGMTDPVSSLEGGARVVGMAYPTSHFIDISRGVFNKALTFGEMSGSLWPLALAVPVILLLAIALLRKQER